MSDDDLSKKVNVVLRRGPFVPIVAGNLAGSHAPNGRTLLMVLFMLGF